jgi:hypothetical protein
LLPAQLRASLPLVLACEIPPPAGTEFEFPITATLLREFQAGRRIG